MLFDVVDAAFEVPEPHDRVRGQELLDQVGDRGVHLGRTAEELGGLEDALEDLLVVVVGEGGPPDEQLEDEAAQRPVVRRLVVPLGQDQLGGEVLGRAAQRETGARACVCVCAQSFTTVTKKATGERRTRRLSSFALIIRPQRISDVTRPPLRPYSFKLSAYLFRFIFPRFSNGMCFAKPKSIILM